MNQSSSTLYRLLNQLGLNNTEQTLYLLGLTLTEATVTDLTRTSGVNRTTAYHALATLQQKGFARETKVDGRIVYTMLPPADIDSLLAAEIDTVSTKREALAAALSHFPASSDLAVSIEKFNGATSVQRAVEKALYCRSKKWDIIAPKDNFFSHMADEYHEYYKQARKDLRIQSRTLWERPTTPSSLDLATILLRRPRYLPEQYRGKFTSTIIMFDDAALFITSTPEPTAILIRSRDVLSPLGVLFDGLWQAAEKP